MRMIFDQINGIFFWIFSDCQTFLVPASQTFAGCAYLSPFKIDIKLICFDFLIFDSIFGIHSLILFSQYFSWFHCVIFFTSRIFPASFFTSNFMYYQKLVCIASWNNDELTILKFHINGDEDFSNVGWGLIVSYR